MFDANYNKIHLPRIKENSREQLFPEFYCYISYTKLLQKSEMRKDIVIELSYKGFS